MWSLERESREKENGNVQDTDHNESYKVYQLNVKSKQKSTETSFFLSTLSLMMFNITHKSRRGMYIYIYVKQKAQAKIN
jgi:hypothetical protein